MTSSTLTSKGQITLPKAIRERLGLAAGDVLEFVVEEDGSIRVRAPERTRRVEGILRDFAPDTPVSVEEMRATLRKRAESKA